MRRGEVTGEVTGDEARGGASAGAGAAAAAAAALAAATAALAAAATVAAALAAAAAAASVDASAREGGSIAAASLSHLGVVACGKTSSRLAGLDRAQQSSSRDSSRDSSAHIGLSGGEMPAGSDGGGGGNVGCSWAGAEYSATSADGAAAAAFARRLGDAGDVRSEERAEEDVITAASLFAARRSASAAASSSRHALAVGSQPPLERLPPGGEAGAERAAPCRASDSSEGEAQDSAGWPREERRLVQLPFGGEER